MGIILCLIAGWAIIGNITMYRLYTHANTYCKKTYGMEYLSLIREMIKTKRAQSRITKDLPEPLQIATKIGFILGAVISGTLMGALLSYSESRKRIALKNVDAAAKSASIKKLTENERN